MSFERSQTLPNDGDPSNTLIAHLWERLSAIYPALCAAVANEEARMEELELQFRTVGLMMASEPARCWGDVAPKVALAALLRDDDLLRVAATVSHLATMVARAIDQDHDDLNGEESPA